MSYIPKTVSLFTENEFQLDCFLKKYLDKKLFLWAFLFFFSQCTGFHLGNSLGLSESTNPTPEYSKIQRLVGKNGLFYHKSNVAGVNGSYGESYRYSEGCNHSFLYLYSYGDSSIQTLKDTNKNHIITHIDYEHTAILGFVYHQFCTRVYWEKK